MPSPKQHAAAIRAAILRRQDLRYRSGNFDREAAAALDEGNPYRNFCYIATQAFCHLTGAKPWQGNDGMHYWAVLDGVTWDLTAEQFDAVYLERIYANARPTKFKTLCARARALLEEAENGNRQARHAA